MAEPLIINVKIGEGKNVEVFYSDSSNLVAKVGFIYKKVDEEFWHKEISEVKSSKQLFDSWKEKETVKMVKLNILFDEHFSGAYEYKVALFNSNEEVLVESDDSCFFVMPESDLGLKIISPRDVIEDNNGKIGLQQGLNFVYDLKGLSPLSSNVFVRWFLVEGDYVDNGLFSEGGLIKNNKVKFLFDSDTKDLDKFKRYSLEDFDITNKGIYTLIVGVFKEEIIESNLIDQDSILLDVVDSDLNVKMKVIEVVDSITREKIYSVLNNKDIIKLRDDIDYQFYLEIEDSVGVLENIGIGYNGRYKTISALNKEFTLKFDSPWVGERIVEISPIGLNGNLVGEIFRFIVLCEEGDRNGVRFKFLAYKDLLGNNVTRLLKLFCNNFISKQLYEVGVNVFNFSGNVEAVEFGYIVNNLEEPLFLVKPISVLKGSAGDISFPYDFSALNWRGDLILYVRGVLGLRKNSIKYTTPSYIKISTSGVEVYLSDYRTGLKPYGVKFGQILSLNVKVEDPSDKVGSVVLWYQCKDKGEFVVAVDYPEGDVLNEGENLVRRIGSKDFSIDCSVSCDDDFLLIVRAYGKGDKTNVLNEQRINFELLEVVSVIVKFLHNLNSEGIYEVPFGDFNLVVDYDNSVGLAAEVYIKYDNYFLGRISIPKGKNRLVLPYNFKLLRGWDGERKFVTQCVDSKGYLVGKGDVLRVKLIDKKLSESTKIELNSVNAKRFDDYYLLNKRVGENLFKLKIVNKDKDIDRIVLGEVMGGGIFELLGVVFDKNKHVQILDVEDIFDLWWDGNKEVCFVGYDKKGIVSTNVVKVILRLPETNVKLVGLNDIKVINKGERYDIYSLENEYRVVVDDKRGIIDQVRFGWFDEFGYNVYIDLKKDRMFKYEFRAKELWSGDKDCYIVGVDNNRKFVGPVFNFILRRYSADDLALMLREKYLARYLWWGSKNQYSSEDLLAIDLGVVLLQSFFSSLKINQKNIYGELVLGGNLELKKFQYFSILKKAVELFKLSDFRVYLRDNSIRLLKNGEYLSESEIVIDEGVEESIVNLLIGANVYYIQLVYKTVEKGEWSFGLYQPKYNGERGIVGLHLDIDVSILKEEGQLLVNFIPLGEDRLVIGGGLDCLRIKFIKGKEVSINYDLLSDRFIQNYSDAMFEYLGDEELNGASVGEFISDEFNKDDSISLNEQLMDALGQKNIELGLVELNILIDKIVEKLRK